MSQNMKKSNKKKQINNFRIESLEPRFMMDFAV